MLSVCDCVCYHVHSQSDCLLQFGVLEWSMVMAKKGRGWRWRGVCLEVKGKVNQETLARLLPSVSISQHLSFCYNQAFVGGYQTEHDDL